MARYPTLNVLALLSVLVSVSVSAQEPKAPAEEPTKGGLSDEDAERAAKAFIDAEAAVEASRWSDAIAGFAKAYDISKAPTALLNKALSLRAVGRYRDARDELLILIQRHSDHSSIAQAKQLYKEMSGRVAVLSLTGFDLDPPPYEVRSNGALVDGMGTERIVESDPGAHTVVIERKGYQQYLWEGVLADGERKSLEVVMKKVKTKGILSSPAFWILTGVVVAAGAGLLVYLLDRNAQLVPESMNVVELPNED